MNNNIIIILLILLLLYLSNQCNNNVKKKKKYIKNNIEHFSNEKIYAGIVTIPSRRENLYKVINSIINQVDHLYVHLNYNKYDKIPKCLYNNKITISHAKEHGDLGDTGKFFNLCKIGFAKDAYNLTLDDDIIYYDNYVNDLIKTSKKYNDKAIISFHGGILPKNVKSFKDERNLIGFTEKNEKDTYVNIAGTGVALFPPNLLKLTMKNFIKPNTSDLYVAIAAQKQKIPIVILKHPANLLKSIHYDYSLWAIEDKHINNLVENNNETAKQIKWTVHKL